MRAFYYVYKGPPTSFLAQYGIAMLATLDTHINNQHYESLVPSRGRVFDDIDPKMDVSLSHTFLFTKVIEAVDVNTYGELAIYKAEKQLVTAAKAFSQSTNQPLYVKTASSTAKANPCWAERLCIMHAVRTRRNSICCEFNTDQRFLLEIEKSEEAQINYLLNLPLLPNNFNWVKVMQAFKPMIPKPTWWESEYRTYKQLIEDKDNEY